MGSNLRQRTLESSIEKRDAYYTVSVPCSNGKYDYIASLIGGYRIIGGNAFFKGYKLRTCLLLTTIIFYHFYCAWSLLNMSGGPITRSRAKRRDAGDTSISDESTQTSEGNTPTESVKNYSVTGVVRCVQLNIVLYSTCFWIQQSCFPYLSKKLGVDNLTYGYLQTVFAVAQLSGGPLFGRFGDLFGARAALTLAYGCGVLTYGSLALARSIPMLFFSRGLSLFLACMQGSQMVITDVMPYEKRADALGKLGLFYGVGMVAGPFLGGQITKTFGEEAAALVAALGSAVSMIIIWSYVPRHVKHVRSEDQNMANVFNMKQIGRLLGYPNAAYLMSIKIIVGLPTGVLQSMFSRVAMEKFGLSASHNGLVMSYIGIVTMVVQGVGVGYITKRYEDMPLLRLSCVLAAIAYAFISQTMDIAQFCASIFPLIVGMTTMQIVISAALTKAVPQSDTGAMIGLGMGTNSLIRTVTPTAGAYMLEMWGFPSIGYSGALICSVVSTLLFLH